jgi:hypothetical protein
MRLSKIRIESQRLGTVRECLLLTTERKQSQRDIRVKGSNSMSDRSTDQISRSFVVADLIGENAKKMQGADMVRVGRENFSVIAFGLGKSARAMMRQRGC